MLCVERSVPPHKETVTRIAGVLWRPSSSTASLFVLDAEDDARLPIELCLDTEDPTAYPIRSEEDALLLAFLLFAAAENTSISRFSRDEALTHARSIAEAHSLFKEKQISFCRHPCPHLYIVINAIERCTGVYFNFSEEISRGSEKVVVDLLFQANLNGIL